MDPTITLIPVNQIRPLIKRDRDREAFENMKRSIQVEGLLQPIQVRLLSKPERGCKYELVCGQGRVEAFRALRRELIPANILDISEGEVIGRFLSENVLRKALSWLDQAKLIRDELKAGDTLQSIAKRYFVTEGHAGKLLRILKQMSPKVEREFKHLTVSEAESLTSLQSTGQEIVIETMAEVKGQKSDVEYLVRKAKDIEAEGLPLSKTALKQSLKRVTGELAKLRQVLKLKRLHHSLGPENLRIKLSEKEFRRACDKEGINYAKFLEVSK